MISARDATEIRQLTDKLRRLCKQLDLRGIRVYENQLVLMAKEPQAGSLSRPIPSCIVHEWEEGGFLLQCWKEDEHG